MGFELPVDVELANAVVDGINELETLLVVVADGVDEVSVASDDQGFSLHRSQPNLSHLLSSAVDTLKLLFVYEEKVNLIFSMLYY